MDSVHDDRMRKARWTTRGYEQHLNGHNDFFCVMPAMMHLMMMVEATLKGDVRAIGECSGTFSQALLNLDVLGRRATTWPRYEAVSAFLGLKRHTEGVGHEQHECCQTQ